MVGQNQLPAKFSPWSTSLVGMAAMVVGPTGGGVANVAVQFSTTRALAIGTRGFVHAYLSTNANGDNLAAAPSGGVAIGTNGLAIPLIAGVAFILRANASGQVDINVTASPSNTYYLVLLMPGGSQVVSAAIVF